MEWNEEDHPRDDSGRFSSKGEPPRILIGHDISLSKREWAIWYQAIGDIQLGSKVPILNGCKCISVDNKIVLTGGTYERPFVKAVYEFDTSEEADEFRRIFFGRWKNE